MIKFFCMPILMPFMRLVFQIRLIKPSKTFALKFDISSYSKLDEIPYDFIRKRLSVLVSSSDSSFSDNITKNSSATKHFMVTKGALHNVLEVCSYAEMTDGKTVDMSVIREKIVQRFEELGNKGFRILGVCFRHRGLNDINTLHCAITKADEIKMTFLGFLVFFDPIKPDVIESVSNLRKLGISLKIISGDNRHVAAYVGQQIGLLRPHILTGPDLHHMSNDALMRQADEIDIFSQGLTYII
jgi:P-type Mg2+ transporter